MAHPILRRCKSCGATNRIPALRPILKHGVHLGQWGAADGPYYEKAMMMRSMENTIYFASVNYALRFQESATSLIAPSGECR